MYSFSIRCSSSCGVRGGDVDVAAVVIIGDEDASTFDDDDDNDDCAGD